VSFQVCGADCERNLREFSEYVNRNVGKFFAGLVVAIALPIVLLLIGVAIDQLVLVRIGAALSLLLLGLTIIKYPFATPQTIRVLGIRKSIRTAKGLGILLLAGAAMIAVVIQ